MASSAARESKLAPQPQPSTSWTDLDTVAIVKFLSDKIDVARANIDRNDPTKGAGASADLAATESEVLLSQYTRMLLLQQPQTRDAPHYVHIVLMALALGPAEVFRTNIIGHSIARFYPRGQLPSSPMPREFREGFVPDKVLLPLFRRHYIFFRSMILTAALLVGKVPPEADLLGGDKADSFIKVVSCLLAIPGLWSMVGEAINLRTSTDPLLLASLTDLVLFVLDFRRGRISAGVPTKADVQENLIKPFIGACQIFLYAGSINPGPWTRYQKELYENTDDSPVKQLQRVAIAHLAEADLSKQIARHDDETQFRNRLRRIVMMMSVLLGEQAIAAPINDTASRPPSMPLDTSLDSQPITFTFGPLPTDEMELEAILAEIANHQSDGKWTRKWMVQDFCDVCGSSDNLKRCSRCLVGRFCSVDCQRKGLEQHRKVCFDGKEARSGGLFVNQIKIPD